MIKQQCCVYMQEIRDSPAVEVEMCDITKWESHEWQMLLNEVFNTYWFQISENIDSSQLTKSKNTIIEILRAL